MAKVCINTLKVSRNKRGRLPLYISATFPFGALKAPSLTSGNIESIYCAAITDEWRNLTLESIYCAAVTDGEWRNLTPDSVKDKPYVITRKQFDFSGSQVAQTKQERPKVIECVPRLVPSSVPAIANPALVRCNEMPPNVQKTAAINLQGIPQSSRANARSHRSLLAKMSTWPSTQGAVQQQTSEAICQQAEKLKSPELLNSEKNYGIVRIRKAVLPSPKQVHQQLTLLKKREPVVSQKNCSVLPQKLTAEQKAFLSRSHQRRVAADQMKSANETTNTLKPLHRSRSQSINRLNVADERAVQTLVHHRHKYLKSKHPDVGFRYTSSLKSRPASAPGVVDGYNSNDRANSVRGWTSPRVRGSTLPRVTGVDDLSEKGSMTDIWPQNPCWLHKKLIACRKKRSLKAWLSKFFEADTEGRRKFMASLRAHPVRELAFHVAVLKLREQEQSVLDDVERKYRNAKKLDEMKKKSMFTNKEKIAHCLSHLYTSYKDNEQFWRPLDPANPKDYESLKNAIRDNSRASVKNKFVK